VSSSLRRVALAALAFVGPLAAILLGVLLAPALASAQTTGIVSSNVSSVAPSVVPYSSAPPAFHTVMSSILPGDCSGGEVLSISGSAYAPSIVSGTAQAAGNLAALQSASVFQYGCLDSTIPYGSSEYENTLDVAACFSVSSVSQEVAVASSYTTFSTIDTDYFDDLVTSDMNPSDPPSPWLSDSYAFETESFTGSGSSLAVASQPNGYATGDSVCGVLLFQYSSSYRYFVPHGFDMAVQYTPDINDHQDVVYSQVFGFGVGAGQDVMTCSNASDPNNGQNVFQYSDGGSFGFSVAIAVGAESANPATGSGTDSGVFTTTVPVSTTLYPITATWTNKAGTVVGECTAQINPYGIGSNNPTQPGVPGSFSFSSCAPSGYAWLSLVSWAKMIGCLVRGLFVPTQADLSSISNTADQSPFMSALVDLPASMTVVVQNFNPVLKMGSVSLLGHSMGIGSVTLPGESQYPEAPGIFAGVLAAISVGLLISIFL